MKTKVYKALANVARVLNGSHGTQSSMTALDFQTQMMDKLVKLAPSGSGFDSGTQFLSDESSDNKLVFETSFHHMDEHGGYCGWSDHRVIVKPSLLFEIELRITGKNKNGIKDHIYQVFHDYLTSDFEQ